MFSRHDDSSQSRQTFSAAQKVEEVYAVTACQASQPVNAELKTGL